MGFTNKIDIRTLSLVLIALIGGVVGGYISNATMRDTRIEGLSNALTTQLSSKDTEIATLRSTVSMLEEQVSQLEESVADMESVPVIGINTPDFDSGWIAIEPNTYVTLHHNLGTTNIFVYIVGNNGLMNHAQDLGLYFIPNNIDGTWEFTIVSYGCRWTTNGENAINVSRQSGDEWYDLTRVLIWVLPDPPELTTTP